MELFGGERRGLGVTCWFTRRCRVFQCFALSRALSPASVVLLAAIGLLCSSALAPAGLSSRSPERELETAMVCASNNERSNPCGVNECFADYLAITPGDEVAPSATQTISAADAQCRASSARDQNRSNMAIKEEERALQAARQCMAGAADCVVKSCYSGYLSQYGAGGALRALAQADVSDADQRCQGAAAATIIADGNYNAKSERGCGVAAQFGIRVAVRNGEISWEHRFRGTAYRWVGAVDQTGGIRASVGNSTEFVADGRYSDSGRQVIMHYPQCSNDPITLSIIGRL